MSKREHNNYFTITATSVKSITKVIEYFSKNPLLSIKYRDYKDWEIVSNLILKKEHYIQKEYIKLIKSGMNSRRTDYEIISHYKQIIFLDK